MVERDLINDDLELDCKIGHNSEFKKRARISQLSLRYQRDLKQQKLRAARELADEQKFRQQHVLFNPKKGRPSDIIDGARRDDITLNMAELMLDRTRRGYSTNQKIVEEIFSKIQIKECSAAAVEAALFSRLRAKL